jgi:hypothetical protein
MARLLMRRPSASHRMGTPAAAYNREPVDMMDGQLAAEIARRRHRASRKGRARLRRGLRNPVVSQFIYGANGYTGELIAREAKKRGANPILAGETR